MTAWMWLNILVIFSVIPLVFFYPDVAIGIYWAAGVSVGIRLIKERR